jgi:TonB family protein
MSSRRIVASTAGMAGLLMLIGSHSSLAVALTATDGRAASDVRISQPQAQPRDPRPGVPRPASAREQELQAATKTDRGNLANWLELAKLQEARGATDDAARTYEAALSATGAAREVLTSMAGFYMRTGQFEKAVAALEDVAARNPGDPAGHQLVATYYWEKAQKDDSLTAADRLRYIDHGIAATDRALAQKADYVEALTYKNILLRMKANLEADAVRRGVLIAEADALRSRALALTRARVDPGGASSSAPPPPPPPAPPGYDVDGPAPVRVGGNIKTPTKIRDVRPVYPQEALDARVSGMVILEALIDQEGNVRSARVLRSIPLLDQAAVDAVKGWRYTPTLLNGVPVPVIMTVTVTFTAQ